MKESIPDILDVLNLADVWAKIKASGEAVPALPLLEYRFDEVHPYESDLPEGIDLKMVIRTGLNSHSEYWARLALDWIVQGFPVDDEVANGIRKAGQNSRIDQKVRQQARQHLPNPNRRTAQQDAVGNEGHRRPD